MKTKEILIGKAQHGWLIEWTYTVTTADQFADVWRTAQAGSKWMLWAILRCWWKAKQLERIERAKPGEREAKGWAA